MTTVPTEANKRLVQRFITEVVNTGNVDRVGDFFSPDYVDHYAEPGTARGPDVVGQHVRAVRRTYPDLHVTIEQQFAEGEFVVSRVTATGTHRGDWLGLVPSGKIGRAHV